MEFNWESFTYDEGWLREAVRLEDEADCDIEAGFDWGASLGALIAHPEAYSRLVRLRSMVMRSFGELLAEWNLGVGTYAATVCGRKLLMERLLHPAPEVQQQLLAMLEEDLAIFAGGSDSLLDRSRLRELLRGVLTQQDWELIAAIAGDCVRERVMEQFQAAKTA
ncbi:hypothetical protein H6F74_28430 [Trichocoleus sp. FACHB-90]|uniref:hypothetical protein n=1 Tax=Cyanophyceae TaxID=3028117 RepID=UPI001687790F|nr:hypothetical protein [Trichocoleus sp. FACHB-90]MBD1930117.1 hypothetical protein [Trichocoleus sp. FACHB-90]